MSEIVQKINTKAKRLYIHQMTDDEFPNAFVKTYLDKDGCVWGITKRGRVSTSNIRYVKRGEYWESTRVPIPPSHYIVTALIESNQITSEEFEEYSKEYEHIFLTLDKLATIDRFIGDAKKSGVTITLTQLKSFTQLLNNINKELENNRSMYWVCYWRLNSINRMLNNE